MSGNFDLVQLAMVAFVGASIAEYSRCSLKTGMASK